MSAAITKAQERYAAGDIHWPASLLMELEDEGEGRGFDWVVMCALIFLERTEVENRSLLIEWIKDVATAKKSRSLVGLREKSLKVWYYRRDQMHTGISHLYAALVYFLEEDYREYRKTIFYAIAAIVADPAFSQTGMSIPVEAFAKMRTGTSPMS